MNNRHRVVIVGGGFGGLHVAQRLRRAAVDVTLIDRRNFHLFQPLLYQVATAGLSPANIAAPLRWVLKRQRNTRVLMGEVAGIDAAARAVVLKEGERCPYDTLVLATGATHDYFGHPEWEKIAPGLKTIENATLIRRRIFESFELAERAEDPERVRELLTFAIVGAGPTGVELAGALAEIARETTRRDFRRINPASARIVLIDATDRLLVAMHPALSEKARAQVEKLGVEVRTGTRVTALQEGQLTLQHGGREEMIRAHTILWAAGVRASRLGKALAEAAGAELDRAGRVLVQEDLTIANHPEIVVIGDLAHFPQPGGKLLPGVATVAMQQGDYAAKLIINRLKGKATPPFKYFDKGSMATIGRAAAVANVKGLRFSGFFAWLLWLFIHLMYIVTYTNRILVLVQWAWSYLTFGRAARLITGNAAEPAPVPQAQPAPPAAASAAIDAASTQTPASAPAPAPATAPQPQPHKSGSESRRDREPVARV